MKVGITGHQNIGSRETIEWVKGTLENLISEIDIDIGLTCLARGADQLYAKSLQKRKIPYVAIIASKDYQNTFNEPSYLTAYKSLLKNASETKILAHSEASEEAFYDAGKYLVDNSDLIIAVWDGKPAKGLWSTPGKIE